jgi:hypothetical protein
MANSLLTSTIIANRAMAVLKQDAVFLKMVNRQYDPRFFGKGIGKYGDTGYVRIPQRAVIRDGRVMQIQNQTDTTVPVAINKYKGVDTGATSLEMSLDINDYQRDFIDTKIPDLIAAVEADCLSTVVPLVYHSAGDYGLYNDVSTVLAAGGILSNNLAGPNGRKMLTNITAEQQIVNSLTGFYNAQSKVGDQYRSGLMADDTLGFDWYRTTLMPSLTRGGANTAYETVTTGANMNAAGTSIDIDTGAGTFAAGDIFTIQGVNDVHPQTKADLGYLKQFVVTTASAGGTVTLSFTPAIVTSGPGQNVTAGPAADMDVLPLGTASTAYQQSLAFVKDAFYFITADLPLPKNMGVDCAQVTSDGITLRFMNGFDIEQDMFVSRFDIAYGAGILRPELAVRIPNIPA